MACGWFIHAPVDARCVARDMETVLQAPRIPGLWDSSEFPFMGNESFCSTTNMVQPEPMPNPLTSTVSEHPLGQTLVQQAS